MGVTNLNKYDSPVILTASGRVGPTSTPLAGPTLVGNSFLSLSLKDMDYKSNRWLRIDAFRVYVQPVSIAGNSQAIAGGMPGILGNLNAQSARGIQSGFFLNLALRCGEFEICEDMPLPMFSPRTQIASERELSSVGAEGATFYPRRSANHYTIPLGAPLFLPPDYVPSVVLRRPGDGSPFHFAYDAGATSATINAMAVEFSAVGARVKEPTQEERKQLKVPWLDVFRAVKDDAQWPPNQVQSANQVFSTEQDLRNHFRTDLKVARVMGRMLATPYLEPRDMDTEDRKYPNGFDASLNYCAPTSVSNTQFGGFNPQLEIRDTGKHSVVDNTNWRNIFSPHHNSFLTRDWALKPTERLIAKLTIPDVPFVLGLNPNPLSQRYFSALNRAYIAISGWREERI